MNQLDIQLDEGALALVKASAATSQEDHVLAIAQLLLAAATITKAAGMDLRAFCTAVASAWADVHDDRAN